MTEGFVNAEMVGKERHLSPTYCFLWCDTKLMSMSVFFCLVGSSVDKSVHLILSFSISASQQIHYL